MRCCCYMLWLCARAQSVCLASVTFSVYVPVALFAGHWFWWATSPTIGAIAPSIKYLCVKLMGLANVASNVGGVET